MHTHSQRSAPEAPDLFPTPLSLFSLHVLRPEVQPLLISKTLLKTTSFKKDENRVSTSPELLMSFISVTHTHTHTLFLLEEGWGSLWTKVGYRFNLIDSDSFWFPVIEQTSTVFIEWGKILFDPLLILYVCPPTKKLSVYHFNGWFIWTVRDRITTNYYSIIKKIWFKSCLCAK